jgi:hypothetical protein
VRISAAGALDSTDPASELSRLNGQHVKLIKFQCEFLGHEHDHENERFLVLS